MVKVTATVEYFSGWKFALRFFVRIARFLTKKERITLSRFSKKRIALFIKSDRSKSLPSLFLKERRAKGAPQMCYDKEMRKLNI